MGKHLRIWHCKQENPRKELAGSDQSHVGSVDLAPASPISVAVRNLVFADGK